METTSPPSKTAYSFDPTTRHYLGPVKVYLSPDGRFYLPDNVTETEPPADLGRFEVACLNAKGDAWEIRPSYRGAMLYDVITARPVPNTLGVGESLPEGVTAEPPPVFSDHMPLRNVWDRASHAWRQEPDYSRFPVFYKATGEHAPMVPSGQPLPDTLTTVPPPPFGEHQARRWDESTQDWRLIPDYRGLVYWTGDGTRHVITELGIEPPSGYLTQPPLPEAPDEAPAPTHSTTTED